VAKKQKKRLKGQGQKHDSHRSGGKKRAQLYTPLDEPLKKEIGGEKHFKKGDMVK